MLIAIALLAAMLANAQTDKNGNPVFHSVSLSEETISDFHLVSNYYTLRNNIDSKASSVFIADKPNLAQIEEAAIQLPSDFFMIMKKQSVINMVMLLNKPSREFFVINPGTGEQKKFPCTLAGDIFENRANELIKENYDPAASIRGNQLYFNKKIFRIISNRDIREHLLKLVEAEHLSTGDSSSMKILSKEELKSMILTESKEGGRLDFFTPIKGHENDGVQVKAGLFTTKQSIALYKWGEANFELGVNTVEDALNIWESFKGRAANEREKNYIRMGFNKALEN